MWRAHAWWIAALGASSLACGSRSALTATAGAGNSSDTGGLGGGLGGGAPLDPCSAPQRYLLDSVKRGRVNGGLGVDSLDRLVVVGEVVEKPAKLDDLTLATEIGTFVTIIDQQSKLVYSSTWRAIPPDPGFTMPRAARVIAGDRVAVVGRMGGSTQLGSTVVAVPDSVPNTADRSFVVNQTLDGSAAWGIAVSSASIDFWGVAGGPSGEIVVGGVFKGELRIGANLIETAGDLTNVVLKLDSSGALVWHRTLAAAPSSTFAVAVDQKGDAVALATLKQPVTIAGTLLEPKDGDDSSIAVKLSRVNGTPLWARMLPGFATDVASTSSGQLFAVVAGTKRLLALDGTTGATLWERPLSEAFRIAVDKTDAAIVTLLMSVTRYSSTGDLLSSWCPTNPIAPGNGPNDYPFVTVDSMGRVYASSAGISYDFGNGPIVGPFVLRYSPP